MTSLEGEIKAVYRIGAEDSLVRQVSLRGTLEVVESSPILDNRETGSVNVSLEVGFSNHGVVVDIVTPAPVLSRFNHMALPMNGGEVMIVGGFSGVANNDVIGSFPLTPIQILSLDSGMWDAHQPAGQTGLAERRSPTARGQYHPHRGGGGGVRPCPPPLDVDPPPEDHAGPCPDVAPSGRDCDACRRGRALRDHQSLPGAGPGNVRGNIRSRVPEMEGKPLQPKLDFTISHVVLISKGLVMAVGTIKDGNDFTPHAEIYDPAADHWTAVDSLDPYYLPTNATPLPNGRMLMTGALGGYRSMSIYEVELPDGRKVNPSKYLGTEGIQPHGRHLGHRERDSKPGNWFHVHAAERWQNLGVRRRGSPRATCYLPPAYSTRLPKPGHRDPTCPNHRACTPPPPYPMDECCWSGGIGLEPRNGEILPLASYEFVSPLTVQVVGRPIREGGRTSYGGIVFDSDRDGNYEIYVMSADGSGLTRLTDNPAADFAPSWSPDGTRIAFDSDRDGNDEVYVMNADGSGQTRLTDNPALDFATSWSPDGTRIAFDSDSDGNDEVYVMNADGSGQTRLTDNPASDLAASWSPDGSRIAFVSDRDGNEEVYVMNADGSGQTRLTDDPAADFDPSWSPDGNRIAFDSERDGNWEIYVMNADGSGQTRLTDNPATDGFPSWSPDGSRMAFFSDRDENEEILRDETRDGSGQTRLTVSLGQDNFPRWSTQSVPGSAP